MIDNSRWSEPSRREGEPLRIAVPARGAPEWYLSALVRQLGEEAGCMALLGAASSPAVVTATL